MLQPSERLIAPQYQMLQMKCDCLHQSAFQKQHAKSMGCDQCNSGWLLQAHTVSVLLSRNNSNLPIHPHVSSISRTALASNKSRKA